MHLIQRLSINHLWLYTVNGSDQNSVSDYELSDEVISLSLFFFAETLSFFSTIDNRTLIYYVPQQFEDLFVFERNFVVKKFY